MIQRIANGVGDALLFSGRQSEDPSFDHLLIDATCVERNTDADRQNLIVSEVGRNVGTALDRRVTESRPSI